MDTDTGLGEDPVWMLSVPGRTITAGATAATCPGLEAGIPTMTWTDPGPTGVTLTVQPAAGSAMAAGTGTLRALTALLAGWA